MTIYNLPESDRLAEHVNPVLDEVAKMDERDATLVEVGALSVIGLVDESIADMRAQVLAQAVELGVTETEADFHFRAVIDHLHGILVPRIRTLATAVAVAQGLASEVEEQEEEAVEGLIESLLTSLLGEEAAAQIMAEVIEEAEAEVEAEIEESWDDEDQDEFDFNAAEQEFEQEFEEFLQAVFGRRP